MLINKKFILLSAFICLNFFCYSQIIRVNNSSDIQTSYNIEELVRRVLINGGNCANISNVTISPNTAATENNRSWGYFNKGTSDFPFTDGVILSTGYARKAGNTSILSILGDVLNSGTDIDLATFLNVPTNKLNDHTALEFDFVPTKTTVSFNYLLASEEYTYTYPCTYTDGFALLLKKQGDPSYTNLAVLPNGSSVSVTNIHPFVPGISGCQAKNETFFSGYDDGQTNFNGRTILLTATGNVIPGETYHFKLVIADFGDQNYDSAVFLEGGSFDLGLKFVDSAGVELPESLSKCEGESTTLQVTTPVGSESYTYVWYLNGTIIDGATGSSLTVTDPGTYRVTAVGCSGSAKVIITDLPKPTLNSNAELTVCPTSVNQGVFNLSQANSQLSSDTSLTYKYYENLSDAQAHNTNTISDPNSYLSEPKTVYAVAANISGCNSIAPIVLNINPSTAIPTITATSLSLCGGPITLTSDVTTNITWSTGETTPSIIVSQPGTYTVTHNSATNCGNVTSAPITATGIPNTVTINGNLNFCEGENTVLTSSNPTGNLWSTGETTQSITVTSSGTYTLTNTNESGCTATANATVTEVIVAKPTISAPTTELCEGPITLTSDTTTNITWSTGETTPSIIVSQPGTYSVTAHSPDGNCSVSSNEIVLTGIPNTVSINGNLSFCEGSSAVLTSSNPTGNLWSTGETTQSITAASSGTYTLTNTNESGCTATANAIVTEVPIPVPVITASDTVVCAGETVSLTSNYATGNQWSTGETSQSINVLTSGTYSLTVKQGNCEATTTINITVNPLPTPSISGDLSICAGETTVLTSNYTSGNVWSTGETTQSITVSTSGIYTLSVTENNCTVTIPATVIVNDLPEVNNYSLNACDYNGDNKAKINLTSAVVVSSPSNYILTYYKSLADAQAGSLPISNPSAYQNNLPSEKVYVRVVSNSTGCVNIASIQLNVTSIASQVVNIPAICDDNYDGITSFDLSSAEISSVIPSYTDIRCYLSLDDLENGTNPIASPYNSASGKVIYASVDDGSDCKKVIQFVLNVNPKPVISTLDKIVWLCENDNIRITADSGFDSYLWNTGETTQSITVSQAGTYSLTVSNNYGCTTTFEFEAKYFDMAYIKEVNVNDKNSTATVVMSTSGIYKYSLDGVNWQNTPTFTNLPYGVYNVWVKAGNNCIVGPYTFGILGITNAITPNGDGKNDTWSVHGLSAYPGASVKIYDRYGKVVFDKVVSESEDSVEWNGKYFGRNLPTTTYWYSIIIPDGRHINGFILIKDRNQND